MPTFLGLTAISSWGVLALLGSLTNEIPAFQLLFICFSISAALMFVKRGVQHTALFERPVMTPSQWLIGIVGLFGFHFCYFMALRFAPAIQVSLIVYLWPLILTLFVAEKGRKKQALYGGLIGFTGVSLVISQHQGVSAFSDISPNYMTGYLLAASCALIWSSYSWYLSKNTGSADNIGWLSLVVALLSLIAHFFFETAYWQLSATEIIGALLLGFGPVGGAFYLWDIGMKQGNRSLLAISSFAAPLITAFSLVLAGISEWSFILLAALLLVVTGGFIASPVTLRAKAVIKPDQI